jgi:predicted nucleic acid-binding protein
MEAAQPDYAVTGDERSGLLEIGKIGRTKILSATAFCSSVLHLAGS